MPVLTIGLGVGLDAQNANAQKIGKKHVEYQKVCGLNEGECCLARGSKCSMGWATELDFFYWMAQNPGYTVAYEQQSTATSPNTGSVVRLDSKWDPGFRLGTGWNSNFDRWDLFFDWTWFQDHAKTTNNVSGATGKMGYYTTNPIDATGNSYGQVDGSWRLLHNVFDVELGRAFYLTKALSLRPHLGLRGGWLNQKFISKFTLPVTPSATTEYDYRGKNNYWGIGPRLGIHGQWHIAGSDWSILSKASAALLAGQTKAEVSDSHVVSGVATSDRFIEDEFAQLVPNVQIFLGIDWGTNLDCENYYLGINAGWETDIYWNQYNVPSAITTFQAPLSGSNQAVTMEGVTLNIHFDF